MEETSDVDKIDEIMLPGFRFHPTDEELVSFYLKRKVQQRPLSIELIKQLDIYKYDPWDLPKLATIGEREWYFYCPRDRKYRNSNRPNRVTRAGFWKATGTDRPIYSSECSKCIGLKKSLVFYKGRAAKGIKTDWMMHEFRLPSLCDLASQKRLLDNSKPSNDSWAICRIFKKTNTNAQRAVSHSWVSSFSETTTCTNTLISQAPPATHFTSHNVSLPPKFCPTLQYSSNNHFENAFITSNICSQKPHISLSNDKYNLPLSGFHSSSEPSNMLNISPSIFEDFGIGVLQHQCDGFSRLPHVQDFDENDEAQGDHNNLNNQSSFSIGDEWGNLRSDIGRPLNLPIVWKSNSSSCPSDIQGRP